MPETTQESAIAAELRDDILRGQYRSGERLPSERDLAERFGVHRSTVRAAVKRLEQMGVADVRPGGARVNPIEEASLEVLDAWIALQDPPDAALVDHILDAMNGFLAHAARVGTERASADQHGRLLAILDEMISKRPSARRRGELLASLSEVFIEASGNPVLAQLRHGLRTRYSNFVMPDARRGAAPHEALEADMERLRRAIARRRGRDASEAIYALVSRMRVAIREHLERRARPGGRLAR